MRHIVKDVYGDYSGRPYTLPGAEVIFDEARSRLAYLTERFDVIQLSLIDTFSLNAVRRLRVQRELSLHEGGVPGVLPPSDRSTASSA